MEAVTANAPPELAGPLAAGRRLGRYEVLAKLASGGMAVVYVARAQGVAGFERLVALKVLHANLAHEEEFIRMFLDEARLAARIRHPNVVSTIDISDSAETGYFLVMDYIEGDHLGALLSAAHKANERMPIGVALRIVADALNGLGAAHDLTDETGKHLNLVHRDVSPHNIMVGVDGVSRLTDFGVAKAEDRLTHTRDGQVKGKLAYMAPEQAATGASDARSDLFSMGIILWECVTGRRLFRAGSTAQTLNKLLHEEVPAPSSVHAELAPLDAVLRRALQREPSERYQTADEFAQGIEEVAAKLGGLASLREVGKSVRALADIKLQRDKKLIDDAVEAIRRHQTGELPLEIDGASEPSVPSVASQPSSSLSVSKMSGVFSYATSPGVRPQGAGQVVAAAGRESDSEFPEDLRPRWPQLFMWTAGMCLALAVAWYAFVSQKPAGAPVELIEVRPASEPATSPTPTPAAAEAPEPELPTGVDPALAPDLPVDDTPGDDSASEAARPGKKVVSKNRAKRGTARAAETRGETAEPPPAEQAPSTTGERKRESVDLFVNPYKK
jgi:serine/threonine-protein kinase